MLVDEPRTPDEFKLYYDLRWRVLREPWNQPRGSEKDELEGRAIHVMTCEKDRIPRSIGRAHFNSPEEAQIRYMATEPAYQRSGLGGNVLNALEADVYKKGAKRIILNARESAVLFYEKHGYKIVGSAPKLFGGITHFRMQKEL